MNIKVWDVEYRRDPARTLLARIYQPQAAGPFPVLRAPRGAREVRGRLPEGRPSPLLRA